MQSQKAVTAYFLSKQLLPFGIAELHSRFNPFCLPLKSQLLGMKCKFEHQDVQMFDPKLNMINLHTIGVVNRGGETQLLGLSRPKGQ